MRIEQLVLRRYGHFTDFSLDFCSNVDVDSQTDGVATHRKTSAKPDFHILYGPNEAGKSTTLAGITDLLYGFERVTPWKFLHGNDLLEIEASLKQSEQIVTLKRYKKYLTNSTNDRLSSFPLDLQGLSRDEYRQRFSFDERTLQDGGEQILNSQGDVGQALFSASSGLTDFSNRLESILAPTNSFWMPGKKTKIRLVELKNALQENKFRLNNLKLDVKALQSRQSNLDKATSELTEARQQKSVIADSIRTLENNVSLHTVGLRWMQRKNTLDELRSLGIVTPSQSQTLDISSEHTINAALDEIRQKIQNNQLSESRLGELNKQLLNTRQQNEQLSLSDSDRLYLDTQEAIQDLSGGSSAAIEWEHQQRELNSELERCDALIREHTLAIELSSDTNTDDALPDESQLDSMTALLSQHFSLADRLVQAQDELAELKRLAPDSDDVSKTIDATERIDIVDDVLRRVIRENLVEQYKASADDAIAAKDELYACAQTLSITTDKLEGLQLPEGRIVFSHLDKLAKNSRTVEQLTDDKNNAETDILSSKQQISELISHGAINEASFKQTLALRDSAWNHHEAQLLSESDYSELTKSATLFKNALNSHDKVTTKTLENGKQYAELTFLEQQLSRQENTLNTISEDLSLSLGELEETTDTVKQLISSFYTELDVDNDLVREKLNLAIKLKDLSIRSTSRRILAEEIKKRCDTQHTDLIRVVSTIEDESSVQQLDALELQDLIFQVEKTVARKRQAANELKTRKAERNLHQTNLDRTHGKIARYEKELSEWQIQWKKTSRNTVMDELDADSAQKKIPVIRKLIDTLSRKNDAAGKLSELNSRVENRNQTLASLLATLGTSSIASASNELIAITKKATESSKLSTLIKTIESNIADETAKGQADKDYLDSLCKECRADTTAILIELLQNTARYRVTESLCSEDLVEMTRIKGEEPTSESIELFVESFNTQETHNRIAELATEFQKSESLYDERYGSWVITDKELREIGDNNEYALLHQERSNILLEIEEGAKNTAIALIGERVLKTAISKFRQEHQSVLLTEAQEAFSTLTLGNYTHLIPREDGRGNERLFAIDKNKKPRAVEELSTGTRYQLYLALRAAAHSDYARVRTPLPFVADDIMESFDDERSAAAFEVLGNMATNGQVLYMTHHQHLVPIAQQVLGTENVTVHQLGN